MSDDPPQGHEVLTRWLSQDAGTPPSMPTAEVEDLTPRRAGWRRWRRAGMLVGPWILAVGIVATPWSLGERAHAPDADAPDGNVPTTSQVVDLGHGTAEATAVRSLRDAVTRRDTDIVTALEVAAPERAEPVGAGVWIVRVHAVVLHGDRHRWRSASHEIWAVPVGTVRGTMIAMDRPWRVGRPATTVAETNWRKAQTAEHAVRSALHDAGLDPAADLRIQSHPQLTGVIRAGIVTDGAPGSAWLSTGPPIQVLGVPG